MGIHDPTGSAPSEGQIELEKMEKSDLLVNLLNLGAQHGPFQPQQKRIARRLLGRQASTT
ncbi:hypothetical protein [Paraburkholderia sp. HP33-1]|uniref:hypothetical protein n=1 Tax=Paraburkholderia sp. HP33-1 TaxID=2883243 RepID=UPI001F24712F|nr:hypothetical protein [Paraburkholderia sp. HP33-1]